jgi:hypothetical protein
LGEGGFGVKIAGRIAAIVLAAGLFVGLTAAYVHGRPPLRHRWMEEFRRRRASRPGMRDFPNFVGEFLLVGGVALVGRTVLRVRL